MKYTMKSFMLFIAIGMSVFSSGNADSVVDCLTECRTNKLEYNQMSNFTCNCGKNCTNLVTEPMCELRCAKADDYDYKFYLNRTSLCDSDSCKCVCPPLLTQPCSTFCNSNNLQFVSFTQNFDTETQCLFQNCTCGQVCANMPKFLKDCPVVVGKRANTIVFNFDKFGCPDNKCIYEDCADDLNDFPDDKETFCWKTCPPLTYPQGCFETTLDESQCLQCQCASSFPNANSCGNLPSFSVSLTPQNCQYFCNSLDQTTNKNQGIVVLSPVKRCGCARFTDLTCDDYCLTNENRHGKFTSTCQCQNLPIRNLPLKRRCTELCSLRNKKWSGNTLRERCLCV